MELPRRRALLAWAGVLLLGLAAIVLGLPHLVREGFFHPGRAVEHTPAELGLAHEDVLLTTGDGERLHGFWIPRGDPAPGPAALYLHGNAGTRGGHKRVARLGLLHDLGLAVLAIDYRGYGGSSGAPGHAGVLEDARAALAWLRARPEVDGRRIVLDGESLGGTIALVLGAREARGGTPPAAILTEGAFDDAQAMVERVARQLPAIGLTPLPRLLPRLLDSPLRPVLHMGDLAGIPVLLVHGLDDRVVPFEAALRLLAAAPPETRLWPLEHGCHAEALLTHGRELRAQLSALLGPVVGGRPAAGCRHREARIECAGEAARQGRAPVEIAEHTPEGVRFRRLLLGPSTPVADLGLAQGQVLAATLLHEVLVDGDGGSFAATRSPEESEWEERVRRSYGLPPVEPTSTPPRPTPDPR